MSSKTKFIFVHEKQNILTELGAKKIMVVATADNNIVSARNMCVIVFNEKIYFQTSTTLEKYQQIVNNPNVALCVDNYQIQGTAYDIGPWDGKEEILKEFRKKHEGSYKKYGEIATEVVIEVTFRNIKKWEYIEGEPYIYKIDFENQTVEMNKAEL